MENYGFRLKLPRTHLNFACVHFDGALMQNGENLKCRRQKRLSITISQPNEIHTHTHVCNYAKKNLGRLENNHTAPHSKIVQVFYDWSAHQTKEIREEEKN